MNNIDIIILIVVGISALIALSRGLMKEIFSIVGWVLATLCIIYLLPLFKPLTEEYVVEGWMASVVTTIAILIVFMIVWHLTTSGLIKDIRQSKLSAADRLLGLLFGVARAFLLVILFNIMIGWIMPPKTQPKILKDSKYFQLAGNFAQPIEELLPEETLIDIRDKTKNLSAFDKDDKKEKVEEDVKEDKEQDKEQTKKTERKHERIGDGADELFERLARPQIRKALKEAKKASEEDKKETDGYNNLERGNLDRLIENTME